MSEGTNDPVRHAPTTNPYLVPAAIVLAGLAIAAALYYGGAQGTGPTPSGSSFEPTVLPVSARDHVRGAENPEVYLIEYSDFRCGYCGRYHDTIQQIMREYEGKVAWVYRHTPYQPGGREATVASECIAELAGKESFWTFVDRAMKDQAALSASWHQDLAAELGVDRNAFDACVASGRYDALIAEHVTNAQELGSQGTPYTVLLTKDGRSLTFAGALPIERVRLLVDRALKPAP